MNVLWGDRGGGAERKYFSFIKKSHKSEIVFYFGSFIEYIMSRKNCRFVRYGIKTIVISERKEKSEVLYTLLVLASKQWNCRRLCLPARGGKTYIKAKFSMFEVAPIS